MPSRAIVRGGYGWSGFGLNPEEESRARSGVETSYRLDEEQRYREREARLAEHERQIEALAHERFMAKLAENDALAKRQMAFESEAKDAVPKLLSIDPRDPQAQEKYGQWMLEHGHLALKEHGLPSVAQQSETMARLIEAARKQKDDIDAKASAAQLRQDAKDEAKVAADAQQQALRDAGARPKSATIGGITYEMPESVAAKAEAKNASDAIKKAALTEKQQKEFDEAHSKYTGALDTMATADASNPLPAGFYAAKNFHRQEMKDAADRLKSANPDLAPAIDNRLKKTMLSEHNALQANLLALAGSKLDNNEIKKRDSIIAELNPLKDELGFDRIDPKDPTKTIPRETPIVQTPTVASPAAAPISEPTAPAVMPDTAIPPASPETPAGEAEDAITPLASVATPPVVAPAAQATVPAVAPHPYEGKRVLQKSTGKYGTFTNGQFVPEAPEAQ